MSTQDLVQEAQTTTKTDQRNHPMSDAFARSAIVGIILLIALIHIGFFNTYIRHFPAFNDVEVDGFGFMHFTTVKHFHGMMMMGWVLMLVLQPVLIRTQKFSLHKKVGQSSYLLAPLVILSLFLINQSGYRSNLETFGEPAAVAFIALTFPATIFFTVLYLLGVRYRKQPALHMRFMCSTAFLFIPPAMDRALIIFFGLPGYDVGSVIELSIIGGVTLYDSLKTKRVSPFVLVFCFEVIHTILWHSKETAWWQTVGRLIAKMF